MRSTVSEAVTGQPIPADHINNLILDLTNAICGDIGGTWTTLGEFTSGSSTVTIPANVTEVRVTLVGGGGAGGGSIYTSSTNFGGCGGGAGQVLWRFRLPVAPGGTLAYSVGSGGVAVSGAQGGDGGNTTCGTLTAYGGKGGASGTGVFANGSYGGHSLSGAYSLTGTYAVVAAAPAAGGSCPQYDSLLITQDVPMILNGAAGGEGTGTGSPGAGGTGVSGAGGAAGSGGGGAGGGGAGGFNKQATPLVGTGGAGAALNGTTPAAPVDGTGAGGGGGSPTSGHASTAGANGANGYVLIEYRTA